jgi:two-component system, OmpR family, sensor kinase
VTSAPRDEVDELALTYGEMSSQIAIQLRKIRRTDELRRELIANVSHDLCTPMAALKG